MTNPAKVEIELSPLDQVRQTEADMARRIASAREAAEHTVVQAKIQAKNILDDARETGKREGEKRFREIISNAEEEAQEIIAQARNRAEYLRRRADQRMAEGIHLALNFVIGLDELEVTNELRNVSA